MYEFLCQLDVMLQSLTNWLSYAAIIVAFALVLCQIAYCIAATSDSLLKERLFRSKMYWTTLPYFFSVKEIAECRNPVHFRHFGDAMLKNKFHKINMASAMLKNR